MNSGPALLSRRNFVLTFGLLILIWSFWTSRTPFYLDDHVWIKIFHQHVTANPWDFFAPNWGWYYRPLFLLYWSSMLRTFGPNPLPFHVVSLMLHIGNSLLLGWLCARVWKADDAAKSRRAGALCTLLFFVWPIAQRAVVWASATSTLGATFGSLVCLHCWLFYLNSKQPSRRSLLLVGALAGIVFGLLCKEEAATTIVPLFLLWWEKRWQRPLLALGPFAAVVGGHYLLTKEAYKYCIYYRWPRVFAPGSVAQAWHNVFGGLLASESPTFNFAVAALIGILLARYCNKRLACAYVVALAIGVPIPLVTGVFSGHYGYISVAATLLWFSWWIERYGKSAARSVTLLPLQDRVMFGAIAAALVFRALAIYLDWFQSWDWSRGSTYLVAAEIGCWLLVLVAARYHAIPLSMAAACLVALAIFTVLNLPLFPGAFLLPVATRPLALLASFWAWSRQKPPRENWPWIVVGAMVAWAWAVVTVPPLVLGYLVAAKFSSPRLDGLRRNLMGQLDN